MFSNCVWRCLKCFIRNNVEVLKGDRDTVRSLCGMLVNGGVRSGCRKWWGELKKEEGEEEYWGLIMNNKPKIIYLLLQNVGLAK